MFLDRLKEGPLGSKFLRRDRAPSAADARRVERTLAVARLLLALCSVVAVRADSLEPARYAVLMRAVALLDPPLGLRRVGGDNLDPQPPAHPPKLRFCRFSA